MSQLNAPQQPAVGGTRLVLAALALATIAVVLNSLYIARVQRQATRETFSIYKLTRSVLPGEKLKEKDVERVTMPLTLKPSFDKLGAIDEAGLESTLRSSDVVKQSIVEGEILRFFHFESPKGSAAITISRGMRLVALPVNSRTVSGALRPGAFVDVDAPFHTGGGIPLELPVLENVRVISLGSRSMFDEADASRARPLSSYQSITIELSPQDGTNLAMVQHLVAGDFDVQIRSAGDTKLVKFEQRPGSGAINPQVMDLVKARLGEPPASRK